MTSGKMTVWMVVSKGFSSVKAKDDVLVGVDGEELADVAAESAGLDPTC